MKKIDIPFFKNLKLNILEFYFKLIFLYVFLLPQGRVKKINNIFHLWVTPPPTFQTIWKLRKKNIKKCGKWTNLDLPILPAVGMENSTLF